MEPVDESSFPAGDQDSWYLDQLENIIFKAETIYARRWFNVFHIKHTHHMLNATSTGSWGIGGMNSLLQRDKRVLIEHIRLRQPIQKISSFYIMFCPDKFFSKLLFKFFKSSNCIRKLTSLFVCQIHWTFHIRHDKIIKNICTNLWKVTCDLGFQYFNIGPTHIRKLMTSGKHLAKISFNYCCIADQEWGPTFNNYDPTIRLRIMEFTQCFPARVQRDGRCELYTNIISGIVGSKFRDTLKVRISWLDGGYMYNDHCHPNNQTMDYDPPYCQIFPPTLLS
ncbi:unnamed protein product [Moneuplotes crassus]|uniref:Uncharacterized protein n=1 Tax=Euplotes crassus TaxID=5936 RepID=A0AAD1XSD4_EUPCR|nr:unnamed protein product [Moneuplotes crassus]